MSFIVKMLFLIILINIVLTHFFKTPCYSDRLSNLVFRSLTVIFKDSIFILLFIFVFYQNIYGNIFYCLVPTLNYINTMYFSFSYFIPIVVIILMKQYVNFVRHIIPHGAPLWLFIILPIIELFRFIIRPLTLCIRLSTNLCAGHIIIYMLSNFALDLEIPNVRVYLVVSTLTVLEFFISLLQAYIFCSLIILYYEEV